VFPLPVFVLVSTIKDYVFNQRIEYVTLMYDIDELLKKDQGEFYKQNSLDTIGENL